MRSDPVAISTHYSNPRQLRIQTHLLHLSLLSDAAGPTQTQWLDSAYKHLHTRFSALRGIYQEQLTLSRTVRQHRNLLALHEWTGGNMASLARKLKTFADVLRELSVLTAANSSPHKAAAPGDIEPGAYTKLATQFKTWATWVQQVWTQREHDRELRGSTPSPHSSRPVTRDGSSRATDIVETEFVPLEGLGDAVKTSMRTLSNTLNRLAMRLEELQESSIPLVPDAGLHADEAETPTPRVLLELACAFVKGMTEELQIMKEIDFEVVVGERAWMDERVRRIGGEIEADLFGSPLKT